MARELLTSPDNKAMGTCPVASVSGCGAVMAAAAQARQTIPLWSVQSALEGQTAKSPPRSAAIIPLPLGAARQRRILTYPAAIAVPPRAPWDAAPLDRPLAALPLLALAAPTAVLGAAMVLLQILR